MTQSFYDKQDYVFGQAMLNLRTSIGLTQAGLAELLGVSRKAIGRWEAGSSYPKAEHLKTLLAFAVKQHIFPVGHEEEGIKTFWQAAHQKVLLDKLWLQELLDTQQLQTIYVVPGSEAGIQNVEQAIVQPTIRSHIDWGAAPAIETFYGREEELHLLHSWVIAEHCRVVSVLGMGGVGKSALAVTLMHQVAWDFEVVIWRSLRDTPTCDALLYECLQVLAPQLRQNVPDSIEGRLHLLIEQMSERRVLLVLDNLEVLLEEGVNTGHMRESFEGYAQLLRRMGESMHQSCLLLTSREKPAALVHLEGNHSPVRTLRLTGLDASAGAQLLAEKEVMSSLHDRMRLVDVYRGNPLALKIVAQTIVDIFGGEVALFLAQGDVVFGGVRELLSEQFDRLSTVEQNLFFWLAILREPVSLVQLLAVLHVPRTSVQVLEALEGLHRRSLIEHGQRAGSFTLHSVVLEYATALLLTEATSEIEQGRLARLIEHALELATVKEYIRQTQQRLLVTPLLAELRTMYSEHGAVEKHLLALLDELRTRTHYAQGYGPANIVALLHEQYGHLRGLDLSHLALREVSLQGIEMQGTSLVEAILHDTIFTESFDITWSVAINHNGQYWAAGSRRGEVRVWREEGKFLHLAWQGHSETIRVIAFSPNEDTLATGSWDGAVKLWDMRSGSLLWAHWFTDNIESLAFAPDGHTLASGGDDGIIQILDVHKGTQLQTLSNHRGPVFALAWSPDGSLLASGGIDQAIQLWKLAEGQSGTIIRTLTGHTNWVLGLAFAPDGTLLASGSWDGTVKLWDMTSGSLRQTLMGHTDRVRKVAWSPDGRLLASSGFDQIICLWDAVKGNYRTKLYGHTAGVYDLAFTPGSHSLLSSSEDGTLRVWDMERGQCMRTMRGYGVSLYDVAWSPDGTLLASAGSNMLVTIWNMASGTPCKLLRGHRSLVFGVEWSPDGRLLASSGWDNTVRLWETTTGEAQQILQNLDSVSTLFYGMAWSPDGTLLACASYRQGVQVWKVTTGTRQWEGSMQLTRIRRVAWSPDGMYVASCGDDGSVYLWNASNGTLKASLQGHYGMVMSVAWSPDGTLLASGGGSEESGGELFIWDVQREKLLKALNEPSTIVYALIWSPTGTLLSGNNDGNMCWWNVRSGECTLLQQGHEGAIQSLKVSADGQKLASCGDDNIIQVWDIQSGKHLRTLRQDRPYERLNITGIKGLSKVQKETLRTLGAFEKEQS